MYQAPYTLLFNILVVSNSLQSDGLQTTRLLCPWNFPGKNTGVICYFLLLGHLPESEIESVSPALDHVWMWELDHKESWAPKNWCFWTVVLEKTLESPLDFKEIKPVNPEGNKSWIFIERTDTEADAPILWPPDAKNWLIGKDPDAGKDWRWEEKGTTEDEMVGWHHQYNGHEFEQAPGVADEQGSLACCSPWGCKESETTEQGNWLTDLCIGRWILHHWASREALLMCCNPPRRPWSWCLISAPQTRTQRQNCYQGQYGSCPWSTLCSPTECLPQRG